jgi:hypothetical protein
MNADEYEEVAPCGLLQGGATTQHGAQPWQPDRRAQRQRARGTRCRQSHYNASTLLAHLPSSALLLISHAHSSTAPLVFSQMLKFQARFVKRFKSIEPGNSWNDNQNRELSRLNLGRSGKDIRRTSTLRRNGGTKPG